ncbi:Carbohydrate sulfotransferase 8 [Porphyridium purpureum]|uniref:Carbohydrate sulfotransferase 8 n=1 Tax=Porphyridium purpureum TaxID=35688 RepID=A0A5J4Z2C4_PORPP|nr:Carbohydrate sulfotransferase 8 [Porphyridium purpureum]|eukprot:POR6902..scf208_2
MGNSESDSAAPILPMLLPQAQPQPRKAWSRSGRSAAAGGSLGHEKLFGFDAWLRKSRVALIVVAVVLLATADVLHRRNVSRKVAETSVFSTSLLKSRPMHPAAGEDAAQSQQQLDDVSSTTVLQKQPGSPSKIKQLTSDPRAESVLIEKLPRGYRGGDPVPLTQMIAFEVKRFRRGEMRSAVEPVVPTLEEGKRKAKFKESAAAPRVTSTRALSAATALDSRLVVSRDVLYADFLGNLYVLPEYHVLFCGVPYAGANLWKQFFRQMSGLPDVSRNVSMLDDGLARVSDYSIRDRERLLFGSEFTRVMLVRHPIKRLMAMFEDRVSQSDIHSEAYRDFVGRVRGKPFTEREREVQRMNFAFLLVYLVKLKLDTGKEIFSTQSSFCGWDTVNYNITVRFEDSERGVAQALDMLHFGRASSTFPKWDSLHDEPDIHPLVQEARADPKRLQRIDRMYKDDMQNFGYDTSGV